jgi:hypothetical protein
MWIYTHGIKQNEIRAGKHSGRSDSFSLGDVEAASERRQRMIWALKDAVEDENRAYFV